MQGVQCHESVAAVQCVGMRAVAAFSGDTDVAAAVLREGGVAATMNCLRVHGADPPTTAAACLALVRLTRAHAAEAADLLPNDWEALCEKAVSAYGSTFSITDYISEAVPILRQFYDN